MKTTMNIAAAIVLATAAHTAMAAVGAEEAAKLQSTLTPLGSRCRRTTVELYWTMFPRAAAMARGSRSMPPLILNSSSLVARKRAICRST